MINKKIYALLKEYPDMEDGIHEYLVGVFSTPELALEEIDKIVEKHGTQKNLFYIEEFELNKSEFE